MSGVNYWDLETGNRITDYQLHQLYDDMLDECYDDATIAGMKYSTSRVLKVIDPIAYEIGFCDWVEDQKNGETNPA